MGFSRQEYWSGLPCPPPGDLPNPGIKPRSPRLQADSLPSEPPGKPKNTGVGNLSLLQGNFPTQESNWGLLHCRRILYHMSCQVSLIVSFYSLFFNFLFCSVLFLCSVSGYFCVFCVWLFFIDIMCEKMWRHILRFCLFSPLKHYLEDWKDKNWKACVLLIVSKPKAYLMVAKLVKNSPAMQETLVWVLGWEVPLEKG